MTCLPARYKTYTQNMAILLEFCRVKYVLFLASLYFCNQDEYLLNDARELEFSYFSDCRCHINNSRNIVVQI